MNVRKGISPVVATVLLIIISVGLAALLYAWATGWFGTATQGASQGPKSNIVVDAVSAYAGSKDFTVYVRNIGSVSVTVNALYLKYPNGTIEQITIEETTIDPGDVKEISGTVTTAFEKGKAYVVIVTATDGSRAEYSFVVP
ncbi:MAG TPA: hypothetical protein ENF75_01355 [Acidilobales archaeon]|nr:hypothetical protein [Acidilobales archaeon]